MAKKSKKTSKTANPFRKSASKSSPSQPISPQSNLKQIKTMQHQSNALSWWGRLKRWIKRSTLRLIVIITMLVVVFHLLVASLLYYWQAHPVNNSMFMVLHRMTGNTPVRHQWVADEQIANSVKQAAIASEDGKFVQHGGFDWDSIDYALAKNQEEGKISIGGSTITQQLAKNLFLFPQRSYLRKAEEAIITVMLEKMWDKSRILTVYLNIIEFGDGIYGIETAAQHYFSRSASQLNQEQAAKLIAMLPQPKYYQNHFENTKLTNRQVIILKRINTAQLP